LQTKASIVLNRQIFIDHPIEKSDNVLISSQYSTSSRLFDLGTVLTTPPCPTSIPADLTPHPLLSLHPLVTSLSLERPRHLRRSSSRIPSRARHLHGDTATEGPSARVVVAAHHADAFHAGHCSCAGLCCGDFCCEREICGSGSAV
jgi:hypothetical protein